MSAQTVVVTGAAAGLGKAIATAFLKAGWQVSLVDISKDNLKTTSAELEALGKSVAIEADVSDEDSCRAIFERTLAAFGRVDALVNCAGIMDRFQGADEQDIPLWNKILAINLTGPFLLTKFAVQAFLRQDEEGKSANGQNGQNGNDQNEENAQNGKKKGGAIINIASVAGLRGAASGAAYTSAKWGLIGLTKNTAAAYAKEGIRCNALCPSAMATSITDNLNPDIMGRVWNITGQLNAVNPGYIDIHRLSRLILFLSGEDGEDINGAAIPIDHGWTMM